jgi:hypothetical protein
MMSVQFYQFSLECLLIISMEIGNLFYFNIKVLLSSSTIIGSLSYYPTWVLIYSTTVMMLPLIIFLNPQIHYPQIIGLSYHGNRNFKKLG